MNSLLVGLRRKSRVFALQALYEIDISCHEIKDVFSHLLSEHALKPEVISFSSHIVNGVVKNKQKIDAAIHEFAPLFPTKQIAIIDRNILRIAIFEILFDNKVPVKVAVNEAIELAKSFGGDTSPKFINGVLGSIIAKSESLNQKNNNINQSNKLADR